MLSQVVKLFCCSFFGRPIEEVTCSVWVLENTLKSQHPYLTTPALLLSPLVFQTAPWPVNSLMTSEIAVLTGLFPSLSTERINP